MKHNFIKSVLALALGLFSMSAMAQTNLFDASNASVISTWGAGDVNPTATWTSATGTLDITLNTVQPGWQWGNQVAFAHGVTFEAGKYYQISMTFTTTVDCGGVTLKIDDNNGMLYENQSINLTAATPLNYSKVIAGVNGGNNKAVFDFGYGEQGTNITVSNIVITETEAPTFDGCEGTFVASSGNAANGHDGNTGTRWESSASDPQYWQWNMAEAQTFNRIKIVWEGAYAKTFNIKAGTECDNLATIASIENQSLSGFPHTQIIELAESVTASSIQFEGLERGTGYGYSFWEFDVYEQQTPVLSGLDFTAAATICKTGEHVNLTATPKDQYDQAMAETVTYTVTPAAAGHVTAGVYYADAAGSATITATCGAFNKEVSIFNHAGENVALSTNLATDNKIIAHNNEGADGFVVGSDKDPYFAVDENEGSVWQGSMTNGGSDAENDRTFDAWFVVDLGANYDIELVTINFEGACSQNYHVDFSADNVVWTTAYNFVGTNGIYGRTDYIFPGGDKNLTNNHGVRYVRFFSTKAATQWGVKLFSFKVFGTPAAEVYERNVAVGDFGTICLDKATSATTGATFYTIDGVTMNNGEITAAVLTEYNGNLVAGTPYIFKATATTLTATLTGDAVANAVPTTGLVGNLAAVALDVPEGAYVISNNQLRMVAAGGAATVAQNRAYIELDELDEVAAAPGRLIMPIDGNPVATGIENTAAVKAAKALVNGQLVIVRNGAIFNLNGMLVK